MHLLGMCKIDRRKYLVGNRELNAHQLIVKNQRKNSKYSRKHKSTYISIVVDYKGEKVRLFFILQQSKKTLLLTTDLTLSFVRAIELYQIRPLKSYSKKSSTCVWALARTPILMDKFNIVLATHTILSLQKRFSCYETMGELFREAQTSAN
jgi:hypothetical protein